MKKALIGTLMGTMILAATPVWAAGESALCSQNGLISVTGIGEYKVKPDLAVLSFEVSSYQDRADAARAEVEKTVTAFTGALKDLKLPENSITANNLNLSPRYESKDGKVERIMYQASRVVTVKLEDFAMIANVTDLALQSGINAVGSFSYQLKDKDTALDKARDLAIADAKDQAQKLAAGFEVKLGKPCSLSFERSSSVIAPRSNLMMARAMSADAAGSESVYIVNDITVSAQVYASFGIE